MHDDDMSVMMMTMYMHMSDEYIIRDGGSRVMIASTCVIMFEMMIILVSRYVP